MRLRPLGEGCPAACSRGGLQFARGDLELSEAVAAQQGGQQGNEFAHDGDQRDLVELALGAKTFIVGRGVWFEADRGRGGLYEPPG